MPDLIKLLKQFQKECTTVKSLISFGRITTIAEALDKVGAKNFPIPLDKSARVDHKIWSSQIEPELYWKLITDHSWNTSPAWNEQDFLLESTIETPQENQPVKGAPVSETDRSEDSSNNKAGNSSKYKELVASYIPPKNPQQKASLFYFQENAAEEAWYRLVVEDKPSVLLRAGTGDGKTYGYGQLLRWFFDSGLFNQWKVIAPVPVLVVTKASIIEQTKRVLKNKFGLNIKSDVKVVNYDALRASWGKNVLEEKMIIEGGYEHFVYQWHPYMHPCIIVWDECQALKNEGSQQTKIASSFNDIPLPWQDGHGYKAVTKQIFSSATPFSRLAGAKCFAVSTRHIFTHGAFEGESILTNNNWMDFAKRLTVDGNATSIYEYNKSNIKRLLRELNGYIVGYKNVRRKHKPNNYEEVIDFETVEQAEEYEKAWQKYLEAKARIERNPVKNSQFLKLVELLKFRQAAEFIRAPILARRMYEAVNKGQQVAVAACFKPTIAKIVSILYNDYNVDRSKISLIWGGNDALSKSSEEKYSPEDIKQILAKMVTSGEFNSKLLKDITAQVIANEQGLGDLPPELKLGNQSKDQRQEEIDKLQSGRSLYCLFTFGAGGAGLSLHHTYEYFDDRPEEYEEIVNRGNTLWPPDAKLFLHKKTNLVYTTLPRRTFVTPTWNEMELEQALGRVPRLTSLSDTDQTILLFRGTVEVNVLRRVNQKRVCLSAVVTHTEMDEEARQLTEMAGSAITDDDENEEEGSEIFEEEE